jgi:hypothetical protein
VHEVSANADPSPRLWWGRIVAVAAILVVSHALIFDLAQAPLSGDRGLFLVIAQEVLRGGVPHEAAFDHKPPGYPTVAAAAMVVGRWVGLEDVLAARCLDAVGLVMILLLVASLVRKIGGPAWAGLASVAAVGSSGVLGISSILGGEPKVPMLVMGLASLVLFSSHRALAGGLAVGVASLFWQPGALFLLGVLSDTRSSPSALRRWANTLTGFAAPWILVTGFYAVRGSLSTFLHEVLFFNLGYVRDQFPIDHAGHHLQRLVTTLSWWDLALVILGAIGWLVWLRKASGDQPASNAAHGVLAVLAAFCLLSLANHQGPSDHLPLQVLAAPGVPMGIAALPFMRRPRAGPVVAVLVLVAVTVRLLTLTAWGGPPRLEDQRAAVAPIVDHIRKTDRGLWCAGVPAPLVLGDLPNATPYTYLHSNAHLVLEAREGVPLWSFIHHQVWAHDVLVMIDRLPADVRSRVEADLITASPGVVVRRGADIGLTWRPDALVVFAPPDSSRQATGAGQMD